MLPANDAVDHERCPCTLAESQRKIVTSWKVNEDTDRELSCPLRGRLDASDDAVMRAEIQVGDFNGGVRCFVVEVGPFFILIRL